METAFDMAREAEETWPGREMRFSIQDESPSSCPASSQHEVPGQVCGWDNFCSRGSAQTVPQGAHLMGPLSSSTTPLMGWHYLPLPAF